MRNTIRKDQVKGHPDLSRPLQDFTVEGSDCFGREWLPLNEHCSICGVFELCGGMFEQRNSKQALLIKKELKVLDNLDFSVIDTEVILKAIKEYLKAGEEVHLEDVIETIKPMVEADFMTLKHYSRNLIYSNGFTLDSEEYVKFL